MSLSNKLLTLGCTVLLGVAARAEQPKDPPKPVDPNDVRQRQVLDEQERQRQFQIEQAKIAAKAEADRLERDKLKIDEERRQREEILRQREEAERRRIEDLIRLKREAYTGTKREQQLWEDKHADAKRKVTLFQNKLDGANKLNTELQKQYTQTKAQDTGFSTNGVSVRNDVSEQLAHIQRKMDSAKHEIEVSTKGLGESKSALAEADTKLAGLKRDQEGLKKTLAELGFNLDEAEKDAARAVTAVKTAVKTDTPAAEKTIKLKDGTVLKASKVIDFGDTYALKGADGKITNVNKTDVDEIK